MQHAVEVPDEGVRRLDGLGEGGVEDEGGAWGAGEGGHRRGDGSAADPLRHLVGAEEVEDGEEGAFLPVGGEEAPMGQ